MCKYTCLTDIANEAIKKTTPVGVLIHHDLYAKLKKDDEDYENINANGSNDMTIEEIKTKKIVFITYSDIDLENGNVDIIYSQWKNIINGEIIHVKC